MTTTQHFHRAQTPVSTIKDLATKRGLTILTSCLALLAPGIASAAKPAPSPDAGCVLLLSPDPNVYPEDYPDYVITGQKSRVKLVRDPSYPGAFRSPSVKVDVTVPMLDNTCPDPAADGKCEWKYSTDTSISSFYVTYVQFAFDAPPYEGNDGVVDLNGDVVIEAEVTEEVVSRNGKRTETQKTKCTTKTAKIKLPPTN